MCLCVNALFDQKSWLQETRQKVPVSNLFSSVLYWAGSIDDPRSIAFDLPWKDASNHWRSGWIFLEVEHRSALVHQCAFADTLFSAAVRYERWSVARIFWSISANSDETWEGAMMKSIIARDRVEEFQILFIVDPLACRVHGLEWFVIHLRLYLGVARTGFLELEPTVDEGERSHYRMFFVCQKSVKFLIHFRCFTFLYLSIVGVSLLFIPCVSIYILALATDPQSSIDTYMITSSPAVDIFERKIFQNSSNNHCAIQLVDMCR